MISKGNHVKFTRFVLLAVSEEAKTFFFVQCIVKQLLDSVFVISRIIKVSVRVISLSLRLITLTLTLIILEFTKTSSSNCLLIHEHQVMFCTYVQWFSVQDISYTINKKPCYPHPSLFFLLFFLIFCFPLFLPR